MKKVTMLVIGATFLISIVIIGFFGAAVEVPNPITYATGIEILDQNGAVIIDQSQTPLTPEFTKDSAGLRKTIHFNDIVAGGDPCKYALYFRVQPLNASQQQIVITGQTEDVNGVFCEIQDVTNNSCVIEFFRQHAVTITISVKDESGASVSSIFVTIRFLLI